MTVLNIIKSRYAAKSFTGEKIKNEDLKKLKESIVFAPSSFNWQPWKIKIIDDKETLLKLKAASFNQPQIGNASHLFVFCAMDSLVENNNKIMKNMEDNLPKDKFEMYSKMLDGAIGNMSPESQKAMSERELFLPAANLSLVATDLGLASCHIGGFVASEYKKILNLDDGLEPIVIIPVGIPKDKPRPKFRFKSEEIFI